MNRPVTELPKSLNRETRTRRILVRDLVLDASIGIYGHERERLQRVRINLDLAVIDERPLEDDIANVVCYEQLVVGARRLVSEDHINLVETLAERLAEMCLCDDGATSVRVRVEKLDVFPDVGSVGVEIERFKTAPLDPDIEWLTGTD